MANLIYGTKCPSNMHNEIPEKISNFHRNHTLNKENDLKDIDDNGNHL